MNKPEKCKNCQWYGKPYWSIINPCDNCFRENTNKEREIAGIKIIVSKEAYDEYKGTLQEQLEEKDKEIERLNNIIKRFEEDLREMYITFGEFSEEYTEKKLKELKEGDKND